MIKTMFTITLLIFASIVDAQSLKGSMDPVPVPICEEPPNQNPAGFDLDIIFNLDDELKNICEEPGFLVVNPINGQTDYFYQDLMYDPEIANFNFSLNMEDLQLALDDQESLLFFQVDADTFKSDNQPVIKMKLKKSINLLQFPNGGVGMNQHPETWMLIIKWYSPDTGKLIGSNNINIDSSSTTLDIDFNYGVSSYVSINDYLILSDGAQAKHPLQAKVGIIDYTDTLDSGDQILFIFPEE